jgi:hypothetical protein
MRDLRAWLRAVRTIFCRFRLRAESVLAMGSRSISRFAMSDDPAYGQAEAVGGGRFLGADLRQVKRKRCSIAG